VARGKGESPRHGSYERAVEIRGKGEPFLLNLRKKSPRKQRATAGGNTYRRGGLDQWSKALKSNRPDPRAANGRKAGALARGTAAGKGKASKG
jgi:hypothetical protein